MDKVIEVSLYELQTPKAKKEDITVTGGCAICGKPINEQNALYVHLLTNGNIVSSFEDFDNSQGCFPVGSECAKKLIINFAKKIN